MFADKGRTERRVARVVVTATLGSIVLILLLISFAAHYPNARSLTSLERSHVESVFRQQLDVEKVRITYDSPYTLYATMTFGNTVHVKTSWYKMGAGDDLTASRGTRFALVHELAHVMQYQNKGWSYFTGSMSAQLSALLSSGSRLGAYDWRKELQSGTSWEKWNPEAQAEAIAAYARYDESAMTEEDARLRGRLACTIPLFLSRCAE